MAGLLVGIGALGVGEEQCMVEGERRIPSMALQAASEAQEWGEEGDAGAGGASLLLAGHTLHLCQL